MKIIDLKDRLRRTFAQAKEHCDLQYAFNPTCPFSGTYVLRSREFAAGLDLLDDLVQHDSFTSMRSLKQCRHALQSYRNVLENDCSPLAARQVAKFISEIDTVWMQYMEQVDGI